MKVELADFIPKDGRPQRLYCSHCSQLMELTFNDFEIELSGVEIRIAQLPMLNCMSCGASYHTDRGRYSVVMLHERAIKNGQKQIGSRRRKTEKDFGFTSVPFQYDSDDYYYIPGLFRQFNEGYLTPVFFNKDVLLKYEQHPKFKLFFASPTYGTIYPEDDYYFSFGINRAGKVIMWLGDISKLSDKEQYYLLSENIPSDHSIASEFYEGQIECVFTEPHLKDKLFKARSKFVDECHKKFGIKIAKLEMETLSLAADFNEPIVDTNKERRHVADLLNKIYIETLDASAIGSILDKIGIAYKQETRSLKRLELLAADTFGSQSAAQIMRPFFVLADLRVIYSHLTPDDKAEQTLSTCLSRLSLPQKCTLAELYAKLCEDMLSSFGELHKAMTATS